MVALPWRSQQSTGGDNMTKMQAGFTKEIDLTLGTGDRPRGEQHRRSCLVEKQRHFYSNI